MDTYNFLQGRKSFDFRIGEKPFSEVQDFQVLVRVILCGVCGSDVLILKNYADYTPLGHEISAQVEKIGWSVTRVHEGDLVVVEDVSFCGQCEQCQNGRTDLCQHKHTLNGQSGMGEYLVVDEALIVPANGADPLTASLTEPLAVAMNAVLATNLVPAGNILVFGLGALGIMASALARYFGAGTVVNVGSRRESMRNIKREETVRQMGADAVFYSSDMDLKNEVDEIMSGQVDAVLVTSPPASLPVAARLASYGAPIVMLGLDMRKPSTVALDMDSLVFNKNSIISVLAEPARLFPQCLRLIKTGRLDVRKLITHQFTLGTTEKLREAYENDTGVIKAVFINRQ